MVITFEMIKSAPRLLLEAELEPLQGERFQPAGFADLGPARYRLSDGTEMLLLESTQSVANRLELACCKDDRKTLLDQLSGLPHVASEYGGTPLTTSYLEAHRLSSPYLLNKEWAKLLSKEMKLRDEFQVCEKKIAEVLFKYDPCSLLHGVWLSSKEYKTEFSGGRVRMARALSGFIEARDIAIAESGGTKFDRNAARLTDTGNAETGYGTLPFHRAEFTAGRIVGYFNLDLALLRSYELRQEALEFLVTLALFKVRRFLSVGLRLRTACDLKVKNGPVLIQPAVEKEICLDADDSLLEECKRRIETCTACGLFAKPPKTVIQWTPAASEKTIVFPPGTKPPSISAELGREFEWKPSNSPKKGSRLVVRNPTAPELADRIRKLFEGDEEAAKTIDEFLRTIVTSASNELATENEDD